MSDLDTFKAELARLNEWRAANTHKLGTIEFRRSTMAHRLLTDLVRSSGGTATHRSATAERLKEIETGKYDHDDPPDNPNG